MTLWCAAAAALLTLVVVRPRPAPARRLARVFASAGAGRPSRRPILAVVAVSASVAATALHAWPIVLPVLGVALAARRRRRSRGPAAGEVAFVAELLASCLRAGASAASALRVVAGACADPGLRSECLAIGDALRRGTPPDLAWRPWMDHPMLGRLARPCLRTATSGAAVADELVRVAARLRTQVRSDTGQGVARAGVWVVLPMGLCFLPAFVLVGVVPLVVGLLPALR